jgi:hypothetical protein
MNVGHKVMRIRILSGQHRFTGPASVYRASIGLPGQHRFTGPASVYRASIGLPGQHRFTGPASVYRASIGLPGQHRFTGPASRAWRSGSGSIPVPYLFQSHVKLNYFSIISVFQQL